MKTGRLIATIAVLAVTTAAEAETAVQTFGRDGRASHPGTLRIDDAEGGEVITVDLSKLPAGAKVYAGRLFMERVHVTIPPRRRGEEPKPVADDALAACEVFAGAAPAGKPLKIVGPWFDHVDVTAAVAKAAGGELKLFVKDLPGWRRAPTRLEVAWDAPPGGAEQGARPQVADVRCVHHAGQTFITWKEIEDLSAGAKPEVPWVPQDAFTWRQYHKVKHAAEAGRRVRYSVYRHTRPITVQTLHGARRIAVVEPLSGWNVHGANSERAIDLALANKYAHMHGHWNPFADARLAGPWGRHCPLDRFVIPGSKGRPLPRGAGLYVHTCTEKGTFHYAVVAGIDGSENTGDLGRGNAPPKGVAEAPGEPQPVLQRELPPVPFWDYPQKRLHYVRWVAPPYGNRPCQYCNWSVSVPEDPGNSVPLELSLPRDDRSYWRTQFRVEPDSIVVTPYDWPLATWWYGYHESLGTLKGFRQGIVHNYTERRVMAFLDWAAKTWPVDRRRILIIGVRRSSGGAGASSGNRGMGVNGAVRLALRHPGAFNVVLAGYGLYADYRVGTPDNLIRIWGKPQWGMKTFSGREVWDELDLVRIVRMMPPGTEPPLMTMSTRAKRPSEKPLIGFTNALLSRRFPVMFQFNYWPGPKLLPVAARGKWPAPMIRLDVRRDRPLPAFRAMTVRKKKGYFAAVPEDQDRYCGEINVHFRWDAHDLVDEPGRVEMTLWAERRWARGVTSDVTIRRLQRFTPAPGARVRWTFKAPAGDRRDEPVDQSGEVAIGPGGLLIVPAVKITGGRGRLVVTK